MSVRWLAVFACVLLVAFALAAGGPWLAGRSRIALVGLALSVALGAPRSLRARPAQGSSARHPALWLALALAAPPLGLAAALDRAAGLPEQRVAALALGSWALVVLAGVAARAASQSARALRLHAALWSGLVLGAPLALGVLAWIGRAPAPGPLAFAAAASPLAWLAERTRAPSEGGAASLLLALCGALALVAVSTFAAGDRPQDGERA